MTVYAVAAEIQDALAKIDAALIEAHAEGHAVVIEVLLERRCYWQARRDEAWMAAMARS
jgi:hypothetical protein